MWTRIIKRRDCATVTDREQRLEEAIPQEKGQHWSIATESQVDGYIISGAYSDQGNAAIGLFRPGKGNTHQFQRAITERKENVITDTVLINEKTYHLIWLPGIQTEYAEVTYTVVGQKPETRRFDTTDMSVICTQFDASAYTMDVVYYDSEGNQYK